MQNELMQAFAEGFGEHIEPSPAGTRVEGRR